MAAKAALPAGSAPDRDLTLPPHSLQAEQAVLGSVLKSGSALLAVADILQPEDFYNPANRQVWAAMLALHGEGRPPGDYHLLTDYLERHGWTSATPPLLYLADISTDTPTAVFIAQYGQIVVRTATHRRLIALASDVAEQSYRDRLSPEDVMADMERRLIALAGRMTGGGVPMADAVEQYRGVLDKALARYRTREEGQAALAGYDFGYIGLNRMTLGAQAGHLGYLAARTGVGKSVFIQQAALHIALKGAGVYFASLEMSVEKLIERATAMGSRVSRDMLALGKLTEAELDRVSVALDRLEALPVIWDATARETATIRLRALRYRDELAANGFPLGAVVVDYVQLLEDRAGDRSNRVEDLGLASRNLKKLAEELGCLVLAAVQVSREVLKREVKTPTLGDLRESGNLEQDADWVVALDRDDYHDKDTENPGVGTITLLKNRDGGSSTNRRAGATAYLKWLTEGERYTDLYLPDRADHGGRSSYPPRPPQPAPMQVRALADPEVYGDEAANVEQFAMDIPL